jgi:hypothetical protein
MRTRSPASGPLLMGGDVYPDTGLVRAVEQLAVFKWPTQINASGCFRPDRDLASHMTTLDVTRPFRIAAGGNRSFDRQSEERFVSPETSR